MQKRNSQVGPTFCYLCGQLVRLAQKAGVMPAPHGPKDQRRRSVSIVRLDRHRHLDSNHC